MEEKENIVLYDWLSFTSKKHTPEELIQALGLTHCPWQETKGAHGYRDRKYFSCISVHYNGREDMGVWVELSGQGCRTFESLSSKSWDDLFQWITAQQLKITRLDVAFDDHTGVLDIAQIVEDTRQQHYVSRSDYWETVLSSKGSTVQIGSPKSKVLVRIYDKAAERHCEPGTHWIRVELQLRDDRAAQFCKLPMTVGEAFSGVVLNYLRYVVPDDTDMLDVSGKGVVVPDLQRSALGGLIVVVYLLALVRRVPQLVIVPVVVEILPALDLVVDCLTAATQLPGYVAHRLFLIQ